MLSWTCPVAISLKFLSIWDGAFFTFSLPTRLPMLCSYGLMELRFDQPRCLLSRGRMMLLIANLALMCLALPAWAELGGSADSVKADQEKMNGSLKVTATSAYQIHEIQSAQGVTVREFVAPSGTVFGVAWQGPWKPDLRQLLGAYFDQYVNAVQGKPKTTRGPSMVQLPGLVVQSGGHMRAFVGRAYLPQMITAGTSVDAIR
jgi:Protein of unknown function (DUF2844)